MTHDKKKVYLMSITFGGIQKGRIIVVKQIGNNSWRQENI